MCWNVSVIYFFPISWFVCSVTCTNLFYLLWYYNESWCLIYTSRFLSSLSLYGSVLVIFIFHPIWRISFQFWQRFFCWDFYYNCINTIGKFGKTRCLAILSHTNLEHGIYFHLIRSSLIGTFWSNTILDVFLCIWCFQLFLQVISFKIVYFNYLTLQWLCFIQWAC